MNQAERKSLVDAYRDEIKGRRRAPHQYNPARVVDNGRGMAYYDADERDPEIRQHGYPNRSAMARLRRRARKSRRF